MALVPDLSHSPSVPKCFPWLFEVIASALDQADNTTLLMTTIVEVGMSFSVMVNFLGLSILILFVPALAAAFSSSNDKNLFGQSNLLFIFAYVSPRCVMSNIKVLNDLFSGLNALSFVLVFFLVSPLQKRVNRLFANIPDP
jgi:uncharacterized membrane protein YhaH (DUF805 family)